jgi:hypothetical protein
MSIASADSVFNNPLIALLIGAAVSLDVIALTFCSSHIYKSGPKVWRRWAKYNAGWHAGLLIFYLLVIDIAAVFTQYVGVFISIPVPDWLTWLQPIWAWFGDRFRSHVVVYAAIAAMCYVWYQYSKKVYAVPTDPDLGEAPFFLRPLFRRGGSSLSDSNSRWFWHLSCCLVAVDMLALAAVVKSGEKLIQFPRGIEVGSLTVGELTGKIIDSFDSSFFIATATVSAAVFVVVYLLCLFASKASKGFWTTLAARSKDKNRKLTAVFIVLSLKLLEPFVIFYFIIHSMAFLATGVPLHSPAFLLGSGLLVAALIQYVTFTRIVDASTEQVEKNVAVLNERNEHV